MPIGPTVVWSWRLQRELTQLRNLMDQSFERNYKAVVLDKLGHSLWTPAPAPPFAAYDSTGETVQLSDFAGKNVILIFYLGGECLHCMEQMREANKAAKGLRETRYGVRSDEQG